MVHTPHSTSSSATHRATRVAFASFAIHLALGAYAQQQAPVAPPAAPSTITTPSAATQPPTTAPLFMTMRMPIGAEQGRLDQLAYDARGADGSGVTPRLFVAAPGNGTVEVVSLAITGTPSGIKDLPQPMGLLWMPDLKRLFVACGGDGSVRVFTDDSGTFKPLGSVVFSGEAEDLVFDPVNRRIVVSHARSVSWLDPDGGAKGDGSVKLSGHAEALVLETRTGERPARLYASVARPAKGEGEQEAPKPHVAVIDPATMSLVTTWTLDDAGTIGGNHALALDEAGKRLFVTCRQPAKTVVIDTTTGKVVAALDCASDSDGVAFDPVSKRLFVVGGGDGGRVSVFKQRTPDEYVLENTVSTWGGASTCLLVPDKRLLLVVAPTIGGDRAALFHYEIRN